MHEMFVLPSLEIKNILYICKTTAEKDFEPAFHTHGNLEILLIVNGHGSIHIGDKTFQVKEKDLFIINSKERHCEFSQNKLEFYALGITHTIALREEELKNNGFLVSLKSSYPSFLFLFEQIYSEAKLKKNQYLELITCYFKSLEHLIIRKEIKLVETPHGTNNDDDIVLKIKQIIDANYYTEIKLQNIAQKMSMSISSICHTFKKQTGISIFQYKLTKQLEEACNLLKISDMTISEIASLVGFSDSSCFIKIFKNKYNMTPKMYRQKKQHLE